MASYREQGTRERFEKRKLTRFPVQLPIEIGHQDDDLSSICTNLSRAGVSVETSASLVVRERLAVAVVLAPKEEPLRMIGQVVWIRDLSAVDPANRRIREIGIRFLRPLPTAQTFPSESDEAEREEMEDIDIDDFPDLPPAESF